MSLADAARDFLEGAGIPPWLVVVALTLAPILEVRASIPVAMLFYDWGWAVTFATTFLASLLIIPLAYGILILFERLARYSRRLAAILDWLWLRTRRKSLKAQRAGHAGLFAIVALPLPGAGTWTACLTAYVLGMPAKKALPTIVLGAIVECAILVIVVLFFRGALHYLA
ncbi:MAG: small multi-drug export protein [Candidatus Thermoplasmatota archaeon]